MLRPLVEVTMVSLSCLKICTRDTEDSTSFSHVLPGGRRAQTRPTSVRFPSVQAEHSFMKIHNALKSLWALTYCTPPSHDFFIKNVCTLWTPHKISSRLLSVKCALASCLDFLSHVNNSLRFLSISVFLHLPEALGIFFFNFCIVLVYGIKCPNFCL